MASFRALPCCAVRRWGSQQPGPALATRGVHLVAPGHDKFGCPGAALLWWEAVPKKKLTVISIGQITKNPEVRHFIFLFSLTTWGRVVEGRALGGGVRDEQGGWHLTGGRLGRGLGGLSS